MHATKDLKASIAQEIARRERDIKILEQQLKNKIDKQVKYNEVLKQNLAFYEQLQSQGKVVEIQDWHTAKPHYIVEEKNDNYKDCHCQISISKYSGTISVQRYEYVKIGDRNIRVYKDKKPIDLIDYDSRNRYSYYNNSNRPKDKAKINSKVVETLLDTKYKTKIKKLLVDLMTNKWTECYFNNRVEWVNVPEKISKLINFV